MCPNCEGFGKIKAIEILGRCVKFMFLCSLSFLDARDGKQFVFCSSETIPRMEQDKMHIFFSLKNLQEGVVVVVII